MKINVTFTQTEDLSVIFADKGDTISANFGEVQVRQVGYDTYTGETVITPSDETQTLNTAGLAVNDNIVINPIPTNYGRIAWDGRTITVY